MKKAQRMLGFLRYSYLELLLNLDRSLSAGLVPVVIANEFNQCELSAITQANTSQTNDARVSPWS